MRISSFWVKPVCSFVYWMYHSWGTLRRRQGEAMSEELQEESREGASKVEYLLPLMLFPVPCGDSWTQLNSVWEFLKGKQKTAITEGNPVCQVNSAFVGVKDRSVDPFDLGSLVSTRAEGSEHWLTFDLSYRGSEQLYQMYPSFIGLGGSCLPTVDQYSQSTPGCKSDGVPGGVSRHVNSRRLSDWLRLERGGKIMTTWFKKMFS